MDNEQILRTEGLTMKFGGVTAVNNVNLSINYQGELRCLLGPNGAGKSTFFKCLTGQLKPTEGKIEFLGHSISGMDTHDIVNLGIGIKTQVPNLFNGLTAYENVRLAAKRRHMKSYAIERTLETAFSIFSATSFILNVYLNIIEIDIIIATGFTKSCPAMSGADP